MRAGRIGLHVAASVAAGLLVLGQAWGAQLEQGQSNGPVRTPNDGDLDTATRMGDFAAYFTHISAWLNQRVSPGPDGVSEAALDTLLKDPVFANALSRRRLISKLGLATLGAFAKADSDSRAFLAWLLRNTEAMDLYLEGGTPTGIQARPKSSAISQVCAICVPTKGTRNTLRDGIACWMRSGTLPEAWFRSCGDVPRLPDALWAQTISAGPREPDASCAKPLVR
jgi:hypothetical protein